MNMDKFNIAFFSSSDFVIPIIESVYTGHGQTLKEVFEKQLKWLNDNQSDFVSVLPKEWLNLSLHNLDNKSPELQDILSKKIQLMLIVSQPDRVNHGKTVSNPVVKWSRERELLLFTPNKINKELEDMNIVLAGKKIDMAILASFGQILSEVVLEYPSFGFVNWHPSLLPKYRGPTPMQTALASGDTTTGLSWLEMTKAMDAGDIWLQLEFELGPKIDFKSLADQMAELGANTWALPIVAKLGSLTNRVI